MWGHVGLVRTDVLEGRVASIFRAERKRKLGTTLTVTSKLIHNTKKHLFSSPLVLPALKIEAGRSSETSVLTHGATYKKTALLIISAAKTSDLKY
jgi:hypothetical protein